MTDGIVRKSVVVWSETFRLAAELIRPPGDSGGAARPAVLFCHGWSGVKEHLAERYPTAFAEAGYVCLIFDYRGWGGSDGYLVPRGETPMLTEPGDQRVDVRVVREIIDPRDQLEDVRACFAYLIAEEGVDPDRVGVWGTSYGAGHVLCLAGIEPRVKAVVAQVGGYGHPAEASFTELARTRMSQKARGELEIPVPQGIDIPEGIPGTPDVARQYGHAPLDYARAVTAPTLFLDVEHEQYNDPSLQGGAANELVRRNTISERHVFPGTHYEIYDKFLAEARARALAWFDLYL